MSSRLRIASLALVAVALSGCAASLADSGEGGGVVANVRPLTRDDAFRIAEDHCAQYQRVVRVVMTNIMDNTMHFECVLP